MRDMEKADASTPEFDELAKKLGHVLKHHR